MSLANINGKEHLRHRAVSLRQHGFLVSYTVSKLVRFLRHSVRSSSPYLFPPFSLSLPSFPSLWPKCS